MTPTTALIVVLMEVGLALVAISTGATMVASTTGAEGGVGFLVAVSTPVAVMEYFFPGVSPGAVHMTVGQVTVMGVPPPTGVSVTV